MKLLAATASGVALFITVTSIHAPAVAGQSMSTLRLPVTVGAGSIGGTSVGGAQVELEWAGRVRPALDLIVGGRGGLLTLNALIGLTGEHAQRFYGGPGIGLGAFVGVFPVVTGRVGFELPLGQDRFALRLEGRAIRLLDDGQMSVGFLVGLRMP